MILWLSTIVLHTDQNSFGVGDQLLRMKEHKSRLCFPAKKKEYQDKYISDPETIQLVLFFPRSSPGYTAVPI